jgi:hypothetical protein
MAKFRKKPVVIEADQYIEAKHFPDNVNRGERPGTLAAICFEHAHDGKAVAGPHVHTLEGFWNDVTDGDWIIKGVKGEFYPCKPDIFAATYDAI